MAVGWLRIWAVTVLYTTSCAAVGPEGSDWRELAPGPAELAVSPADSLKSPQDVVMAEGLILPCDLVLEMEDLPLEEIGEAVGDGRLPPSCPLASSSVTTVTLHDGGPVAVRDVWPLKSGGVVVAANISGSQVYWNGQELPDSSCAPGNDCVDGLLLRLDGALDLQWVRRVGGPGVEALRGLVEAQDGRIVVVGETDSQLLSHGELDLASIGQRDGIVLAFEADGMPAWGLRSGGAGDDGWNVAASGGAGELFVGGWFESPQVNLGNELHESLDDNCILLDCGDLLLARLDEAGGIVWSRSFGGNQGERFGQLDWAGAELVVAGSFGSWTMGFDDTVLTMKETICGPMFGCSDLFLARFSTAGETVWAHGFGGDLLDTFLAGAVGPDGSQALVGEFSSSGIDFGGGALVNDGGQESFVAVMEGSGEHRWSLGVDAALSSVAVADGKVYVSGLRSAFNDGWGGCLPDVGRQRITVAAMALSSGEPLARTATAEGGAKLTLSAMTLSVDGLVVAGSVDGPLETAQGVLNEGVSTAVFLQMIGLPLTTTDDPW